MKLSPVEVLRRAVADAHRAAARAHTAAYEARRKMDAVAEAAKTLQAVGSSAPTIKAFVAAETARIRDASLTLENDAWAPWRELGDLAEFMGAKDRGSR